MSRAVEDELLYELRQMMKEDRIAAVERFIYEGARKITNQFIGNVKDPHTLTKIKHAVTAFLREIEHQGVLREDELPVDVEAHFNPATGTVTISFIKERR